MNANVNTLNRALSGSGYLILKWTSGIYVLSDPNSKEVVRSKKLGNLYPFVESIVKEHEAMMLAGKTVDIRAIIKPTRSVNFNAPSTEYESVTYHILAIVEWNRVVVKYWAGDHFEYDVIHMDWFVKWFCMGRLS